MPTYNNLKNLRDCVASLKDQTYNDFEVWIIDGGSSDGSLEYLASLAPPFYYVSEKDDGIYDAMNKGINQTSGQWLYFIGADDKIASKNVFTNLFENKINTDVDIIAGKVKYPKRDGAFIYSKNKSIKNPSWNFTMWLRNGLHHQGTVYRRSMFELEKFNINYPVLADYAFNLKAYKNNKNCLQLPMVIANCAGTGISKSGSWKLYQEEYLFKTAMSWWGVGLFHYLVIVIKFYLRKGVHDTK